MKSHEQIQDSLACLCSAETTEEELGALTDLSACLSQPLGEDGQEDADRLERIYLDMSTAALEDGNPYPGFQVTRTEFCSIRFLLGRCN